MIKTDIVDYIVNNTTLSRSQAINATDSVIEAISHSLIKGESVFIRVASPPSRRLLQPLKRLVISTKERLLLFRHNIPPNSC